MENVVSVVALVVSILTGLSAFFAIMTYMKNKIKDVKEEGKEYAQQKIDNEYIRQTLNTVALDVKDLRRQMTTTSESYIRLDEHTRGIDDKLRELEKRVLKLETK